MERWNTEGRAQEWNATRESRFKTQNASPCKITFTATCSQQCGRGLRLKTIVARIHDESHSPRFPKVLLIIYARRNLSVFLEALMIHSHLDSYLVSKITISIDTAIFICIE